jgi:NADH:ubiquinone oxidoreductase subunit 3 (subunit A)
MNNYLLPKKAKDIKGAVAVAELRRAHYIIAMLAIAFAVMIGFTTAFELQFDATLGIIVVILLLFVAIVSLGTAFLLRKR